MDNHTLLCSICNHPPGGQSRRRADPDWEEAIIAILAVLNKYPDVRQEVFAELKFLYQ